MIAELDDFVEKESNGWAAGELTLSRIPDHLQTVAPVAKIKLVLLSEAYGSTALTVEHLVRRNCQPGISGGAGRNLMQLLGLLLRFLLAVAQQQFLDHHAAGCAMQWIGSKDLLQRLHGNCMVTGGGEHARILQRFRRAGGQAVFGLPAFIWPSGCVVKIKRLGKVRTRGVQRE